MKYEVTVSNKGNDEIKFEDKGDGEKLTEKIIKFVYKLNSIDDDSAVRDRGARVELRIEGIIDAASYKEVCKLAQWSVVTDSPMREIKVVVKDDEDNIQRTYEFDNMFCVDYEEIFEENKGSFKLFVAQAPNYKKLQIFDF